MIETKWFQFAYCEVPAAADPRYIVRIPEGTHLVTFDDVVSRAGNGFECEIGLGSGLQGPKARILRSTLEQLCAQGSAVFAGDA